MRRDGHRPRRGHRRLRRGLQRRRARRPAALLQDARAPVLGVADRLLDDFAADEVWVRAAKPEPPIPLPVEEVSRRGLAPARRRRRRAARWPRPRSTAVAPAGAGGGATRRRSPPAGRRRAGPTAATSPRSSCGRWRPRSATPSAPPRSLTLPLPAPARRGPVRIDGRRRARGRVAHGARARASSRTAAPCVVALAAFARDFPARRRLRHARARRRRRPRSSTPWPSAPGRAADRRAAWLRPVFGARRSAARDEALTGGWMRAGRAARAPTPRAGAVRRRVAAGVLHAADGAGAGADDRPHDPLPRAGCRARRWTRRAGARALRLGDLGAAASSRRTASCGRRTARCWPRAASSRCWYRRGDRRGYLGLGSNLGDRRAQLQAAVDELPTHGVRVLASSSTYETEPVGEVLDQPAFLNACVRIETELEPEALLDAARRSSAALGAPTPPAGTCARPAAGRRRRAAAGRPGARSERLAVPHPQVAARRFVLIPLLELDLALATPDGDAAGRRAGRAAGRGGRAPRRAAAAAAPIGRRSPGISSWTSSPPSWSICSVVCSMPKRSSRSICSSPRAWWQSRRAPTTTWAASAGKPDVTSQTCRSWTSTTRGATASAWPISSTSMPAGRGLQEERLDVAQQPERGVQHDRCDEQRGDAVGLAEAGEQDDRAGDGRRDERRGRSAGAGRRPRRSATCGWPAQRPRRREVHDDADERHDQDGRALDVGRVDQSPDALHDDEQAEDQQRRAVELRRRTPRAAGRT